MATKRKPDSSSTAPVEPPPKVIRRKLADYVLDPANPNKGTPRGDSMLETSVELFGPARSGVADQNGVIRAGNHTAEQLAAAGIEAVIEVETTGKEWVVVRRVDMDESAGQQYAVADNRTTQVGLDWDNGILKQLETAIDLTPFFNPQELKILQTDITGEQATGEKKDINNMRLLNSDGKSLAILTWGDIMIALPMALYQRCEAYVSQPQHPDRAAAMTAILEEGLKCLLPQS